MKKIHVYAVSLVLICAWGILDLAMWEGIFVKADSISSSDSNSSSLPLLFNATNAYQATQDQVNFGFRIPGTTASRECANYFKANLAPYCIVKDQNVTLHGVLCQNVLGILNPDIPSPIVIIGAHYDTRAITDGEGAANSSNPCPGANDGGSGCGVMLELARDLYQIRDKLNVQVWFVFFDAEDQGSGGMQGWDWCEGSQQFSNNLEAFLGTSPLSAVHLMILLDMVGGTDLQFAMDSVSNNTLQQVFFQVGQSLGYSNAFPVNPHSLDGLLDDHVWFADRGIQTVDFLIDFTDTSATWHFHHTEQDDMAHISVNSLAITGRTVETIFHDYFVSAVQGGGGLNLTQVPSSGIFLSPSQATLISLAIGTTSAVGIFLVFKAARGTPRRPEPLNIMER